MPMMDLTYPEGALSPEARAQVVERLTEALLRHEGAPINRMTRGLTWVYLHELPGDAVNVGGRPVARPSYRLEVTVPEGTLLQGPGLIGATARRNLVREATEIVLAGERTEYSTAEALRVYVLVREIEDGYWGGAGTIVRMEDLVTLANPDNPETPTASAIRAVAGEMLDLQLGPEPVPAEV
jgi:phenylpyruvate tautomerase PptA (4-oxalocrotonate tautomerase family)